MRKKNRKDRKRILIVNLLDDDNDDRLSNIIHDKETNNVDLFTINKTDNTNHHNSHDLNSFDSLIISVDKQHEKMFHFYFDYFKNKPVLTSGYACIFISLIYNCRVKKHDQPSASECIIKTDRRFKIHKSNNLYQKVKLNTDNHMISIPNESNVTAISYCVNGCSYMDTSFKFIHFKHYGVLFNLSDSSIGNTTLRNFIYQT